MSRDFIYKALNDIPGISVVKPHAAFYIFPKIDTEKFNIFNDEQFALDFLHEKQVLVVPGRASTGISRITSVLFICRIYASLTRQ